MTSPGEENNTIITFDRNKKKWHTLDPKTRKWNKSSISHRQNWSTGFTSVVLNEFLYVMFHPLGVYRIKYADPESGWTQLSDLIDDRGWCVSVTTWNESIFVAGTSNVNDGFFSRSAERYIVHLDKWVQIQNTIRSRYLPGIIGAAGYVYLIGGRGEDGYMMNSVERYDLRTNRWDEIAPTPHRTNFTSAIAKGKSIYVVHDRGVMDYNVTTNSWTDIQFEKLWPFELQWFNRLLRYDGKIICIGKLEDFYAVYHLDMENGTFEMMEKMDGKDIWAIETVSVKL